MKLAEDTVLKIILKIAQKHTLIKKWKHDIIIFYSGTTSRHCKNLNK